MIETRSAKNEVDGETALTCLLVLGRHVAACFGHRLDCRVQVDPMHGLILIACNHERSPPLYGAKRAPFDAWNLYIPGDRIAGEAEVTLKSRFGSILDCLR